jgi:putative hydrolase of the HAD superfamily
MKKYRHLFFDLDNTLWDFESNATETLTELYYRYDLQKLGVPGVEFFIEKYKLRNEMMWEQYRLGKIEKETLRNDRFKLTFWDMGLDAGLTPAQLSEDYISESPKKNKLFPDTLETLEYLSDKYALHIITNGFNEVQHIKLRASKIDHLFDEVIISELTGFKKPDVNIFLYAMEKTGALAEECLMIGDGLEIDIAGALNANWDSVFFNPEKISHEKFTTYEIYHMAELRTFL